MWPADNAARRWLAGASGSAPAGPALTAVRSVAARTASAIRCIVIAYVIVQVIIWHSFYAAGPARLAGPAVAVAWGTAAAVYLRHRCPRWQLAALDSAVNVALALAAQRCVPPAMHGDSANWLFIVMAGQLIVPAWFAPPRASAPLTFVTGVAYWAGAVLTPTAGSGDNRPAAAGALLLAIATVHLSGRRMLYRRSARADAALAQADRDSREQYVVLSRNIERREHERLLHDTVLNTLTALARSGRGDADEVVGRCRHDVTMMEYALNDPGDPANATGQPRRGLLADIEAVATEMRSRGLTVHVEVEGGVPADQIPAGCALPVVSAPVAAAIAHAVREALANVISHAGTGEAWVVVSFATPGANQAVGAEPAGLQVTVRDAGAGFDPGQVDPARLGLRRSITERIADRGGRAVIRSAPGEGTVVSLDWAAPGPAGQDAVPVGSSDRSDLSW